MGFEEIGVYIQIRENIVAQSIATRPILELCERYVWRPGSWFFGGWWDQEGINPGRASERAAAVTDGKKDNRIEEAAR